MKLLDWMHRKFKQNSFEPHNELSIGQPSLDDSQNLSKPSYCSGILSKGQRESHLRKSFAGLEVAMAEDEHLGEETADENSKLFHGFLAIGTLGNEPFIDDPSTPTFSISAKTIAEKETEVTENELMLINVELEKVLGAESKDEGRNVSSGRNSYVSTGRSSHCSAITLSGKHIENTEISKIGTTICPLQEYLLGSACDFPETTGVAKKLQRISLGELFMKTKQAEDSGVKSEKGEKRAEKEADKSAVNVMKKMLKKKVPHISSRSSAATSRGIATDSTPAETKTQKILQMFHRKIHPESLTKGHKCNKTTKNEMKNNNITSKGSSIKGGRPSTGEDIIIFPQGGFSRESIQHFKSQSNQPQSALSSGDSNRNKECWIKTDSEYLVLEL